jgi:glycosidase
MPISPIGVEGRKGSLGSYYSIIDYCEVNPEFGNKEDLKKLIDAAHKKGMRVILDWVANHTSRDSKWLADGHKDWYVLDSLGEIPFIYDWTDVAKLNYDNAEMRKEMTESMKYWVKNFNLDGYRCDVAGDVPTDFWNDAVKELRTLNPDIIMLAEAEKSELNDYAFDMYYAWSLHATMNQVAQGKISVADFKKSLFEMYQKFPDNAIPMIFTSNHDENSWNGTEFERMGDAVQTFATLTYCLKGMPLIYNGQEVGMDKRLEFFDKDLIPWSNDDSYFTDFYTTLNQMKGENSAFSAYSSMEEVSTDNNHIFAFTRTSPKAQAFCVFNLSDSVQNVSFTFNNQNITKILDAWGYEITE